MTDVFISYKRADRDRIKPMVASLEAQGYDVWWDTKLVPGDRWNRRIKDQLAKAKCVVVCWTNSSVCNGDYTSQQVELEANDGNDRGVLVPALLDVNCVPWQHKLSHFADLCGWDGRSAHAGLKSLLDGVAAHSGARPPRVEGEIEGWILAKADGGPDSIRDFLTRFPESPVAEEAEKKTQALEYIRDLSPLYDGDYAEWRERLQDVSRVLNASVSYYFYETIGPSDQYITDLEESAATPKEEIEGYDQVIADAEQDLSFLSSLPDVGLYKKQLEALIALARAKKEAVDPCRPPRAPFDSLFSIFD